MMGRLGYETFSKAVRVGEILSWESLPTSVQAAWDLAARAIIKDIYTAIQLSEPCPETLPAPGGYPHGDASVG